MKSLRFALAGPGALGLSLSAAWIRAGHRCVGVYGRGQRADFHGGEPLPARGMRRGTKQIPSGFDVLLIAVPDAAIGETALAWGRLAEWRGKFAFHTSGALPASVLTPLRRRGASIGSFHPLTSVPYPSLEPGVFEGITFALEGDSAACALGTRLIRQMGGRPLHIAGEAKASYHLAACLSSGYMLALLAMAAELLEIEGGLGREPSREALVGLASATLANARRFGLEGALTGPIVRGDLVTLRRHREPLRKGSPRLRRIHEILAVKMLELAVGSGAIERKTAQAMRNVLLRRGRRS